MSFFKGRLNHIENITSLGYFNGVRQRKPLRTPELIVTEPLVFTFNQLKLFSLLLRYVRCLFKSMVLNTLY